MPFNQHIIDNPRSERVRRVTELEKTKGRRKSGKFLIEGPQSVREVVRWMPDVVEDCYVQTDERQSRLLSTVVDDIAREADEAGLYIHQVTSDVMHRMSTDAQGIVAVGNLGAVQRRMAQGFEGREATGSEHAEVVHNVATRGTEIRSAIANDFEADNVTSKEIAHSTWNSGNPDSSGGTVAAFWQIRDPGNAGTVIRSADAAGCHAVIFVSDCVDRFNPKVIRSTAGSLFHLPVVTMSTDEFFEWAAQQHREVIAADVYGTPTLKPESLIDVVEECSSATDGDGNDEPATAILFGNEARGLPADILQRVERIVSIPLYGKAESLNLATSTAVMLFSLAMARDAAQRR
ncbi:RNA methyltransferase [Bifidobacterium sp. ESL0704]|uniref:TrmH family RNA methyltransferase n=1 Tax=Bifidobacterium sp. ESL0704 TaxID=2983219 RepID=UPI0023F7E625|nr:RNA methyltransferase [Bifidobacterium sp. ESL0704]WEV52152.1 RNA methyltransferase [Bifidobacterium sp. ESL0704]